MGVAALRDQLDTFWNRALAAYQDAAGSQDVDDETQQSGQERT
jgi:hypothetical protein